MSKDKVITTQVRKLITQATAKTAAIGALPITGSDTVKIKNWPGILDGSMARPCPKMKSCILWPLL